MRNTDRTKEDGVARVLGQEGQHTTPEEEQGGESALVLRANKGAPELNSRTGEPTEEILIKPKERACVKRVRAAILGEHIRERQAVAADNLPPLAVPEDDLVVGIIKGIGVDILAGTFANGAKGLLA